MLENFNKVLYSQHKDRVKKIRAILSLDQKLFEVEISQKCGVCVKMGYDNIPTRPSLSLDRGHNFAKSRPCLKGHNFSSVKDSDLI